MAEQEIFEARLRTALARRVADGPTDFDALEFARSVAAAEPRRHGRATLRAGSLVGLPIGRSPATRLAWALAAAALLIVATVAAVFVGGELLRRSNELTVVPPPAVDLTITAHPEGVAALAWSPDGTRLGTASRAIEGQSGVAKVWDATTGDELLGFTTGSWETTVATMGYSPDGTRIAIGGPANAVYDAATGEVLFSLGDFFLAYSPDGTRIGAGGAWGWAAVIDAATGDELLQLPPAPSWMSAMAWSPDGTRIATIWGTSIKVWDASTGDERLTIEGLIKRTEVAWSPDGSRIAAARDDGSTAKVYSATTGDELASLERHHFGGVQAIAWSPDGTRIATAGSDGTARIWDAATGAELTVLTEHTGSVTDVAWSPDGTRIATAGSDGTARIHVIEQQLVPSPTPGATAAPTQDPRALRPVGEPTVSDTVLGTITWQVYRHNPFRWSIPGLAGTPHGPVAADDDGLRWLGDDGTWERLALPLGASPLISNGEALFTDDSGVVRRLSWDGNEWVVGEALDVPDAVRPLERIATGPRGTILFGEVDFAIARDFQHFVTTTRPPIALDPSEPFVLATADGFVALAPPSHEPIPWFTVDGTSWEPVSASSPFGDGSRIEGVAGRDGRFVAVGRVESSADAWTAWVSDDGLAWDRLTELGDLGASLRVDGEWPFVGVTASEAGWVIYGKDGSSWASPDGRTWEPLAGLPGVRGMGWSPPEIVLAGDTIVGVGWLRGVTGDVVIGTIERPGGDGG